MGRDEPWRPPASSRCRRTPRRGWPPSPSSSRTAIANAQARMELRRVAEEQAALRRVATLVAQGAPPEEVFAAVAAEAGRLLGADLTSRGPVRPGRHGDGRRRVDQHRRAVPVPVGTRMPPRRAERDHAGVPDRPAGADRRLRRRLRARPPRSPASWGFRAAVGVPISVEGRLWGVMIVASTREEPLPADTEARLAGFTELVAHRDRQRPGARGAARVRRGAGGAAAGGDAGGPGGAAGGGVRRGRRGGRAAARRRRARS